MNPEYYVLMAECNDSYYGENLVCSKLFTNEQRLAILKETTEKYGSETELYRWFEEKTGISSDVHFQKVTTYDGIIESSDILI